MEFSAKQIATFIQGEIVGDENATVHTFAKIEEGIPGAISFLSNPKYTPVHIRNPIKHCSGKQGLCSGTRSESHPD